MSLSGAKENAAAEVPADAVASLPAGETPVISKEASDRELLTQQLVADALAAMMRSC